MNDDRLQTHYTHYTQCTQRTQYSQYSAFQTEPIRETRHKYTSTSPNRELSICNYNYTLVTEEDIEVINLRRKLNEIKKQRVKSEKEVSLLENKVRVLQKEERKVHSYLNNQIRKQENLSRKKSKNKKFKNQILTAKLELNNLFEKNRENIRQMKEKLKMAKVSKKSESTNLKLNKAKEIYTQRIKLNEKRSNLITEFAESNKRKVRTVKLSMDFAIEERRRKESLMRDQFKKELKEKIMEELRKKSKCDKQINTIENKQSEISNKVKGYMSPNVKKKLIFSSKIFKKINF